MVIPAAGNSTRFGSSKPKQYLELYGEPLIVHTVRRILTAPELGQIVVAAPSNDVATMKKILEPLTGADRDIIVVAGGESRQESVANAVKRVDAKYNIIAIHDGVRPFVESRWIGETARLCAKFDGAIVALATTDTIKRVMSGDGGNMLIDQTIPRETIWRAQTPQTFKRDILERALSHAIDNDITGTDEAALVEAVGGKIAIIVGSANNIKVTTLDDWEFLEWRAKHAETRPRD